MAKRKLTLADFTGPNNINTPDPSNSYGIADRDALQAFAWNQEYDVDARRNAIAAALLSRAVAQAPAVAAPGFDQLTAMPGDPRLGGSGDYGMGSGNSPAATGQTPSSVTQQGFFENAQPARSFDADKPPPGQPPDVPVAPPGAPPDVPVTPEDGGRGRVTVTPTPQSMREFQPGWENQEDLPIGEDKYADPADPDKEGTDDAGKEGGAVTAPGGGTPGAAGFPGGATGMPSGGSFASAGQGQISATTGNILGGMNQGTFGMPGGMPSGTGYTTSPTGDPIGSKSVSTTSITDPTAPTGAKSATGKGDDTDTDTVSESDVDQALADLDASMQAMNAVAQAMPGAPTPDPSDFDVGRGPFDPGGPGYSPATSQAMAAQTATAAPAGGKSGFTGVGLPGMVADMTSQGMPSPGGSFSSGWGSTDVDLGDLGAPGAVDTAGLTDTGPMGGGGVDFSGSATGAVGGPGSGMSEGAAAAASEAAAGAAAGGSGGFGGMGAGGGVGPGGMSTGGTGEIGSVSEGAGGIGGAGMGGGVGSPGSGGFDTSSGDTTGTSDTSGGGQGDLGSGDGGPGTI